MLRGLPSRVDKEEIWIDTVDGRNPAPPWMVETLYNPINSGINHLSTGAGFLPSTVALMLDGGLCILPLLHLASSCSILLTAIEKIAKVPLALVLHVPLPGLH
jgi:hypothetical protein